MRLHPALMVAVAGSGGGAAYDYAQVLIDSYSADEVLPLVDIESGTVITAKANANRNGVLAGWALQNAAGPVAGTLAPYSDGANDYGNIYTSNGSTGLVDIFDSQEFSVLIWAKSDGWPAVLSRYFYIAVDGNNRIILQHTAGKIDWFYIAGGTSKTIQKTGVSDTGWLMLGLSVSKSGDAMKAFYNGVQQGTTQTGLGVWVGALTSTTVAIGSTTGTTPAQSYKGWLAFMAVKFGSIWTPTDFANIYAAANP